MLNTRTINYLELIGNGRHYRVPPYQRDYSWTEEQWEDLWHDIVDMRSTPDDRHYLGALVVEERGDREFLIIDGQQRLATLSVLALAVIARLHGMAAGGMEPDANAERGQELRNRFIGEKTLRRSPRAAVCTSTKRTTPSIKTTWYSSGNRSTRGGYRSRTGSCGSASAISPNGLASWPISGGTGGPWRGCSPRRWRANCSSF